jgi:hypothetical protein
MLQEDSMLPEDEQWGDKDLKFVKGLFKKPERPQPKPKQ